MADAYATGSDLAARYDVDLIGMYAGDNRAPMSRADIESDANVTELLLESSGDVDVALKAGKRYTPAQLQSLDARSTSHLKGIVCCLCMAKLLTRRVLEQHIELAEKIQSRADRYLQKLAQGINILGISDDTSHQDASIPDVSVPTVSQIDTRNLLPARMQGRYFPSTRDQHPLDRG